MDSPVERYLRRISAALGLMPQRVRAEELRELRAHLESLTQTYSEQGSVHDVAAQRRAIAQFGKPRVVAGRIRKAWLRPLIAYWGREYVALLAALLLVAALAGFIPIGLIYSSLIMGPSLLFKIGMAYQSYGGIVADPIAGVLVGLLFYKRRQASYLIGGSLYTIVGLIVPIYCLFAFTSNASDLQNTCLSLASGIAGAALFPLAALVTARAMQRRHPVADGVPATGPASPASYGGNPVPKLHLDVAVGRFILCELMGVWLFSCGVVYLFPSLTRFAVPAALGWTVQFPTLAFLYAIREEPITLQEARPQLLKAFAAGCFAIVLLTLIVKRWPL